MMKRTLTALAIFCVPALSLACASDDGGGGDGDAGDGDMTESTGGADGTGGSGDGTGGSEPGPVGAPCRVASQCAPVGGRSQYCSLYSFQDGHCSLNCVDSTECDEGSECREWSGTPIEDDGGSCLATCSDGDCREGYVCTDGVCVSVNDL